MLRVIRPVVIFTQSDADCEPVVDVRFNTEDGIAGDDGSSDKDNGRCD